MATALVTGGSRGLGEALTRGLVGAGWRVVTDARGEAGLEALSRHLAGQVHTLAGDITDPAHRRALIGRAGEEGDLELVVNNAGALGPSPLPALLHYPPGELRAVLDANVVAALAVIQEAAPMLRQASRPRVVNITSDAAVEPYPGWGGYGASKAALEHLSRVIAVEEPSWRVWVVDPGDLRTDMHQAAFPGEDISDRPEPASVVPAFLTLAESDLPSGRYRLADMALEGVRA
jgi:NAD(P)-dependent dehydrogenase (short-subunit alcohol dehydrogenase family)